MNPSWGGNGDSSLKKMADLPKVGYKWGYIFKTGQFAIRPRFEGAYPFHEGMAMVKIGHAIGYIDKTGKYLPFL